MSLSEKLAGLSEIQTFCECRHQKIHHEKGQNCLWPRCQCSQFKVRPMIIDAEPSEKL